MVGARRIQEDYARVEELWSYEEFRRRFDEAYEREEAAAAAAAADGAAPAVATARDVPDGGPCKAEGCSEVSGL
jgi:hypothetical protein